MTIKLDDPEVRPIGRSVQLPLSALVPNPKNAGGLRTEDIRSLAQSIAEMGLLYALIVRKHPEEADKYLIVAGERRWRALGLLKAETAPCIILASEKSEQSELMRVVENHQRLNLTPLEEAAAVRGLLDEGHDLRTVARSLGRSRSWVVRRASLTDLSDAWLQAIKGGSEPESQIPFWPPSHLEVISRFPAEVQDHMLVRYTAYWRRDVPSLADLMQMTGEYQRLLSAAPWGVDDALLCPEIGACSQCAKRSAHRPELFPEELPAGNGKAETGDRCLDPECWDNKADTYLSQRVETIRAEHPDCVLIDAREEGRELELANRLGDRVIDVTQVASCRKSDPQAVPALIVAGPGLGRLKYVQRPEVVDVRSGQQARQAEPADNGQDSQNVVSLADRQARYDKRRRQLVIDAVREHLKQLIDCTGLADVMTLPGGPALAEHGLVAKALTLTVVLLAQARPESLVWPSPEEWAEFNRLKNHDMGRDDLRERLVSYGWQMLRQVLITLNRQLAPGFEQRDNTGLYEQAEIYCRLLELDLTGFRAQAAEKIPYAQSWRAEVTDEWVAANGGAANIVPVHEETAS